MANGTKVTTEGETVFDHITVECYDCAVLRCKVERLRKALETIVKFHGVDAAKIARQALEVTR